jgi:predicted aspartyl protease
VLVIGLACVAALAAQPRETATYQSLYVSHRWFELRDAIGSRKTSPLYTGAVAAAFNRDADAERDLRLAIRESPTPLTANNVRELLLGIYLRTGRSAAVAQLLDEAVAAAPSHDDLRNARDAFAPLRKSPDQTARIGRGKPFPCTVKADGVYLPASVNDKPVEWLFDSGFSHAAMTESEAKVLGIGASGSAKAEDFAGASASMRTGLADRIVIGDAELRHVPVLIFPDSQPPWNEAPDGKKGTMGLPVILALGGIHWTKDGQCSVGPDTSAHAAAPANLAFDQSTPVVRVEMNGKPLDFVLDTGNQGGFQLWRRFGREFPGVAQSGAKKTIPVHQIGGSTTRDVIEIPELKLRIGGFDAQIRPAQLFSRPVGTEFQHGNIGMSVLSQANEVRIDFRAMSLTLK